MNVFEHAHYLNLDLVMESITTSRSVDIDINLYLDLDSHSVFIFSCARDTLMLELKKTMG